MSMNISNTVRHTELDRTTVSSRASVDKVDVPKHLLDVMMRATPCLQWYSTDCLRGQTSMHRWPPGDDLLAAFLRPLRHARQCLQGLEDPYHDSYANRHQRSVTSVAE